MEKPQHSAPDRVTPEMIEYWLALTAGRRVTAEERRGIALEVPEYSDATPKFLEMVQLSRVGAPVASGPQWAKWALQADGVEVGSFLGTRHVMLRSAALRDGGKVSVFKVLSGRLTVVLDGRLRRYEPHDIGVIPGNREVVLSTDSVVSVLYVSAGGDDADGATRYLESLASTGFVRARAALELAAAFLLESASELEFRPVDARTMREVLCPRVGVQAETGAWPEQVRRRVREIIARDHASAHVDVASIAAEVGVSRRQLYRYFSDDEHSVAEQLTRARVDTAGEIMLAQSDSSLATVAQLSGFRSADVLRRAFIRICGQTPSEYRADANRLSA